MQKKIHEEVFRGGKPDLPLSYEVKKLKKDLKNARDTTTRLIFAMAILNRISPGKLLDLYASDEVSKFAAEVNSCSDNRAKDLEAKMAKKITEIESEIFGSSKSTVKRKSK